MKTYPDSSGRFLEKPYYTDTDFEKITADELSAVGLLPSTPEPIRIERFLEKRFDVVPAYEDLGPGIMGATVFGQRGVAAILVTNQLDDGSTVGERRIRTTMAHEGGHGLLHAHLFVLGLGTQPLFGDFSDPDAPRIMCREGQVDEGGRRGRYEWYEYQANRAMSALLLPKKLMALAVESYLEPVGMLGFQQLRETRREDAARELAEIFDVNPAVVRIRLAQLYPADGQGTL